MTPPVPDTLSWTLGQFGEGNPPAFIQRTGYQGVVAELDRDLIQSKQREGEAKAVAMAKANAD